MGHHIDGIEVARAPGLGILAGARGLFHHRIGHEIGAFRPRIHHLVVFLAAGDVAFEILALEFRDLFLCFLDEALLAGRHDNIVLAEGNAGLAGLAEAQLHDPVAEDHRRLLPAMAIDGVDQIANALLGQRARNKVGADQRVARQQIGEHHPPGRRVDQRADRLVVGIDRVVARLDLCVQRDRTAGQRLLDLAQIDKGPAFTRLAILLDREIIEPEHDVLARHDDRTTIGRRQDIIGAHHEHAGFQLRLERQGHMDGHLVAVEIGIERRTDQRMELDRLAFNQFGLKGLDPQTVQRGGPVEHDRMFADHLLKDVPHFGLFLVHEALGLLDGLRKPLGLQPREHEGLEQFERHLLGQPALVQLELRPDHDDRAAGIIDALAQQILPEPALLALEHVGERFKRPLVGPRDGAAAPAIVEQRIDRFLQHPLFIADDDIGRAQFNEPLQAVIAVDDPAVEVVEIGGGKAAAIKRHQRAQFRRNHRDDGQDQPFRPVARTDKGLDQLEALGQFLGLEVAGDLLDLLTQAMGLFLKIDRGQEVANGLGTDRGAEGIIAQFFARLEIIFLGQQFARLELGQAGLEHDILFEIQHPLDILERHVEHQRDARGQGFEKPDMGDRRCQFDMAHPLAPDLLQGHLDAAFLAHNALELHALVFAAQALVILYRAENAGAEQAIALWLEGAVIDGLRLLDLAKRPGFDLFRAGDRNLDEIEGWRGLSVPEMGIGDFLVHSKTLLEGQYERQFSTTVFRGRHNAGQSQIPGRTISGRGIFSGECKRGLSCERPHSAACGLELAPACPGLPAVAKGDTGTEGSGR